LRAGITRVVLPIGNKKDIEEIPEKIRVSLDFFFVETLDQVFEEMLTQKPQRTAAQPEYPFYAAQPCSGWQAQKGVHA
jgi:ATP-dependent Lon protease